MNKRDFLTLFDFNSAELQALIARAIEEKQSYLKGASQPVLAGKTLAMIFEKSSTRTRVSFEAGMAQLGGHALFLSSRDTQLGRGEPIADTAKVISSMVDIVMIRNDSQRDQALFSVHSSVPVINALSDTSHPCQLLADVMTFQEARGSIQGARVAWVGDGNNVCHSWMAAAQQFNFELQLACPTGYEPDSDLLQQTQAHVQLSNDPKAACEKADLVVTDVWASMGQEDDQAAREQAFAGFEVNANLMQQAQSDALFMHCLPAHRGEEVSAEVIDGPQSIVWAEAENRLHAQKTLMLELLGK
ncbi:MAG: ornithine carbamoyltransferase [Oceanococcus sp.]